MNIVFKLFNFRSASLVFNWNDKGTWLRVVSDKDYQTKKYENQTGLISQQLAPKLKCLENLVPTPDNISSKKLLALQREIAFQGARYRVFRLLGIAY